MSTTPIMHPLLAMIREKTRSAEERSAEDDYLGWLYTTTDVGAKNLSEAEDPKIMDTIGSLIDKLITVDLKMWHNQEALYAIRRMSTEEFQAKHGSDLDNLHTIIKRCCDLNVQRSKLVDAIDAKIDTSIRLGGAPAMPQHKTY